MRGRACTGVMRGLKRAVEGAAVARNIPWVAEATPQAKFLMAGLEVPRLQSGGFFVGWLACQLANHFGEGGPRGAELGAGGGVVVLELEAGADGAAEQRPRTAGGEA
jgi:hypothetical protein